ncbi:MAG: tetratricopeptide repeat protein [Rhodothermales bacterium]|nr:tetratricopeptide repeat protein [Rhodothermales bacterium]
MLPLRLIPTMLLFFALAGCNVFEGLYEEGSSDDPQVLVEDADFAIQNGEAEKAIQYLEKALEKEPDNARALAKLTTVRLKVANVDVLTLQTLVDDFLAEEIATKSGGQMQACRYSDGPGVTATEFDYRTSAEYTRLLGVQAALQAAQANGIQLLQAIGQALDQNLSTAAYGSAAARAGLFSSIAATIEQQSGVSESVARQEAAAFLIAFGLTEFTLSILELDTDVTSNQIQWVRVQRNGQDAGISVCAPTQANLDAMVSATSCQVPQLRSGGIALRTRAENLAPQSGVGVNDQALVLEIADELDNLLDDFEAEFPAAACTG